MAGQKLIGEHLRESTELTSNQVVQALRQQVIARDKGVHRRLGDILVDLGYVSRRDVESAASSQRGEKVGVRS